jgi:hypothetical protein
MNKRIKQLAEHAEFSTRDLHIQGDNFQKFAELIVGECVAITDDLVNRNTDGTWSSNELYTDYNGALFEVKRRIKETFGVVE